MITAVGAVVGVATPAQAAVITGSLDPPGTLAGSGFYSVDTSANTLTLSVNAGAMAAGYCMTVYVDPSRTPSIPAGSGSHYDARAVRTCQPYSQRASGLQYEGSTYGVDLTGVNKVGICYGTNNTTGTCRLYNGTTLEEIRSINPAASSSNYCTRFWSRAASGSDYYFSAGNPVQCGS